MNGTNETIVGLDIGSNSVGWAVVEMKGNALVKLHGMGSRIIPSNDDTRNFEQGKAQTRNADRRRYRSMRRNNQRYKLRRANLVKVLKLIGAWPEGLGEPLTSASPMLTALELYGLRADAVTKPISLPDLGRVLYHMNQRRGYKDIGDLMDELSGKEAQAEEKDSGTTTEVSKVRVVSWSVEDAKGKKEILRVVVDREGEEISGTTTHTSFKEVEGQEIYIQIKTKQTSKGPTVTFYRVNVSDWLKGKDELDQKLEESGLHPGQYFHRELLDNPLHPPRFRERVVLRERYRSEFDAIWKRQADAHPALKDSTLRDKVVEALIPRNQALRKQWADKELGTILRDFVIYYQRPLKSQASNKGECRFERKPVVPVSSPVYQLFRIWQQVNNIKLRDKYMREEALTREQRTEVVRMLMQHGTVSEAGLLRSLKLNKSGLETNLRAELPGHVTLSKLRKDLGKHAIWPQLEADAQTINGIEHSTLFKLWHALYSIPEHEYRKGAVKKLLDLDEETAEALAKVRFERKHGAVSARAAARIAQLMVCGPAWSDDQWPMSLKKRVQHVIDHCGSENMKQEMRDAVAGLTSIEQFQGLPYWLAASVAYGDHRAQGGERLADPDAIRSMPRGFLRNPTVEQVVNEALMVVRDIWKDLLKGERPTSFRIELARELRQSIGEREQATKRNRDREGARKKVVERLQKEFGKARATGKDIERFELWEQQKHQCMYSGKAIEASQLFSREADVDHVIPKSLFFDDSLTNKVLCLRSENAGDGAKNNQLAAVYMKGKGEGAYEQYVKRMNDWGLPFGKRKKLLTMEVPESFIARQMNETRYIGTELRKLLERIAPVNTSVGQVTDALKNEWGLTTVYKEVLLPRFRRLEGIVGRELITELHRTNGATHTDYRIEGYDKRIDHRHHALDALVVALTRQKYIQKVAQLKQKGDTLTEEERAGRLTWWPLPHRDLRQMVKDQLERTIPSIKNRQRLVTKAMNRTAYLADPETGRVRTGSNGRLQKGRLTAVRGKLHEEQPMGEVRRQERMPIDKVMRELTKASLNREVPLMDLIHPIAKGEAGYNSRFLAHERERVWLEERLAKHKGDTKAALKDWKKNPPRKWSKKKEEEVDVMELTVLVPYYVSTQSVGNMSKAMMGKVLDTGVARALDAHVAAHEGDYEKALTDDGLTKLNDGRKVPLKRVRIKKHETPVWDADGHRQLLRPGSPNEKLHIRTADNYALAVHVNEETGDRDFDIVSFYDAVQRTRDGLPLYEPRPGHRTFLLRKKDPVYVPRRGEALRDIPWHDSQVIWERIFLTTQFSGKQYYFVPCAISTMADGYLGKEYGSQNSSEFHDGDNPRTKISQVAIPIKVDRLGRVSPNWP
ncbi:MAG: HNH endonuclease domain-containing protein [Flavobacteriales bacterium]